MVQLGSRDFQLVLSEISSKHESQKGSIDTEASITIFSRQLIFISRIVLPFLDLVSWLWKFFSTTNYKVKLSSTAKELEGLFEKEDAW